MKKKLITVLLCCAISLSITGCGETVDQSASSESEIFAESPTESPVLTPTETPTPTEIQVPDENPLSTSSAETNSSSIAETYEYDGLQNIFIRINIDTTIEELESLIAEYALSYTVEEYNKSTPGRKVTYNVAYTDGDALQKYSDGGDHLEISFDKGNNNQLMFAHYVKSNMVGCTALLYNYGVWYDFRESAPGNYSGYYINDSFSGKTGIIMKYSNGNEVATNYFRCNSAEEVIQKIIN